MAGCCAGCQVTHETKFWAQGMDGWRKPHENAQLKWTLMIKDAGILNESEVATNCLNMLIRMCEMYPSRHRDGAIIRLCAHQGTLEVLADLTGREPVAPPPAAVGMGREIFAMFRTMADGAEAGGSAMLASGGL